ncbi:hypothetical protein B4147_3230 [Bacillus wiedmannii]|uniref:Uncharacterized protein n=1 Tax=Bacillus wiedmannii TaxID=1890302 RepID=A0A0G8C673_9BACI|nr:phage protein [Bacillus wiedmannii]KKZ95358.1 hypothetical protein B4147_3230 [Bacillus wiedmannii]
MNQYQMLYSTPYLFSSRTLNQMYKVNKNEENVCAIQEHMLRHEVYLDQQYRGYYYLSQKIEDELLDDYQLYKDRKGNLSIKPKG